MGLDFEMIINGRVVIKYDTSISLICEHRNTDSGARMIANVRHGIVLQQQNIFTTGTDTVPERFNRQKRVCKCFVPAVPWKRRYLQGLRPRRKSRPPGIPLQT